LVGVGLLDGIDVQVVVEVGLPEYSGVPVRTGELVGMLVIVEVTEYVKVAVLVTVNESETVTVLETVGVIESVPVGLSDEVAVMMRVWVGVGDHVGVGVVVAVGKGVKVFGGVVLTGIPVGLEVGVSVWGARNVGESVRVDGTVGEPMTVGV
jgi:hypothetical protein